ncbi:ATP-binding cassette domain-containing protein [Gordonia paraffinivorans]|uniref:ATP-binding cassette domain-containing protein n=1 Tax=Gordonia paraffinivorans TaxID=175628 RepID=UPI003C6D9979
MHQGVVLLVDHRLHHRRPVSVGQAGAERVPEQQPECIVGPNGSGKSTLLSAIAAGRTVTSAHGGVLPPARRPDTGSSTSRSAN